MKKTKILKIEKYKSSSKRYDISVEDNNNFFANDILVHNCENLISKYHIMRQFRYYKTEKLEGTSVTVYLKDGIFGVTGRTIEFKVPEPDTNINELNVYWKMAKKLDLENKMRNADKKFGVLNFALQGEIIGESIQGNIYKLKGQEIRFYNAWNIDKQGYLEYSDFINLINELGLDTVPILDDNYKLPENSQELLLDADKTTTVVGNNPKQLIEGFVYIAKEKIPNGTRVTRANFNRLSFKAKSRVYDERK